MPGESWPVRDWCGDTLWLAPREGRPDYVELPPNSIENPDWHHDIVYRDGAFYSLVGQRIARVNAATGAIEWEVDLVDVMQWAWRDGLSLLDARLDLHSPIPKTS